MTARDEVRAALADQLARFERAVGNLRPQELTNETPSLSARLLRAEPIVAPANGLSVLNARGVSIASSTPSLSLGTAPPWLPRALETTAATTFFVCVDPECQGGWLLVKRFDDMQGRLAGFAFTTLSVDTVRHLLTPVARVGAIDVRAGANGQLTVDWTSAATSGPLSQMAEWLFDRRPERASAVAEIANVRWLAAVPAFALSAESEGVLVLALLLPAIALVLLSWPIGQRRDVERLAADLAKGSLSPFGHRRVETSSTLAEAEHLREQLDALARERDRVLAAIGHDVRTPINSVLGICALLAEGDLEDAQRKWIRRIRASCESLLAMLNGILEIAAAPVDGNELHVEPVDIAGLAQEVGEVLRPQADDKGLELSIIVEDRLLGLWNTDPTRIRQILLNLIGNAIKYTVHGTVEVRGLVSAANGHEHVEIRVSDTGPGIADSEREIIFEQFRRGRDEVSRGQEGLGLGLALCRDIATLLHGTVSVESTLGAGSVFTFRIPSERVNAPRSTSAPLAGRNAVVVGLSEGLRRRVAGHLERLGFDVETTADGFMAIGAAERTIFQHGTLDILVTDGDLAGLSSEALIRRLRAHPSLARLKIALVTNDAGHAARQLADATLAHPVEASDLDRAVAALFGAGSPLHDIFPSAPASPRHRVLVVEDNHVNRMLYLSVLNRSNFSAFAASSGEDAIEAALRGGFDVILMDVQMPGIDGIETTRRIRAMPGQETIPIIGVTAHSGAAIRKRCLDAGMTLVLHKPVDPSKLHLQLLETLKGVPSSTLDTRDARDFTATIDVADEALELLLAELGIERARACIDGFLQDTERHVEILVDAVSDQEWSTLTELAHSLAGASSTLGAAVLANSLLLLEDSGRAVDRAQAETALAELRAVWERTRHSLRARFEAIAGRRGGTLQTAA